MDEYKFRVQFLEEAKEFLDGLDEKARDKIPKSEIERVEKLKEKYFNDKSKMK